MRLVQVAKALGMTGQQLRKELTLVDFGVKPTDREIPDSLAQGVLRYLARKYNVQIQPEALTGMAMDDSEAPDAQPQVSEAASQQAPQAAPAAIVKSESLHVLRKLTLDDVPKEAIQKQADQLKTKKEREERLHEDKAMIGKVKPKVDTTSKQEQIKRKEGKVMLPDRITVKELSEKLGIQVPQVIQVLMKNGVLATITQAVDFDTAAVAAAELGIDVQKEEASASAEMLISKNLEQLIKDEPEHMVPRPPVVVVMGHVDHGKTSILDAIRQTDVVSGESGGITQHIGAYQVRHGDKSITFLDTPGHEAFASMRARGAQITDVAVLVVSAEEGVRPTTIEAIHHAKDAGVPIIVAINKMDRPNADPERVKGELAGQGLQPEEWGGTTPMVPCSAVTKQGINDLLDHILLVAELENPRANPNRLAVATVIESHLDPSLGAKATVIVNAGTLRTGDVFVCGRDMGRVRTMADAHGERLDAAGPSSPVEVSGFDGVPQVGDILQAVPSDREAKVIIKQVFEQGAGEQKRSLSDLVSRLSEGKLTQLKIVLKADAQGSLEALQGSLEKQARDNVTVKVIHGAVGAVSDSDVMLASASGALVVAFRVMVSPAVLRTAEREGVQVRMYEVIYTLLEEVDGLLKGLLTPEEEEQILGHLEVKGVFLTKKNEQIIGGRVTDGVVKRLFFRLQRAGALVGTGRITSLRKVDKDIKEAAEGSECGLRVESTEPVQEGDVLEVFVRELKKAAA